MNLITIFHEGGFIMYPLLVCLLLSLVIIFEKIYILKKFAGEIEKLGNSISGQEKPNFEEYNHVLIAPFKYFDSHEAINQDEIDKYAHKTLMSLKDRLWILGTVTSSAPFIGLFGTVVGIIKSFASIGEAGQAGFAVVSADLSEALIATAAGILVAVIALILFNFINQKIKNLFFNYQFELERFVNHLVKK